MKRLLTLSLAILLTLAFALPALGADYLLFVGGNENSFGWGVGNLTNDTADWVYDEQIPGKFPGMIDLGRMREDDGTAPFRVREFLTSSSDGFVCKGLHSYPSDTLDTTDFVGGLIAVDLYMSGTNLNLVDNGRFQNGDNSDHCWWFSDESKAALKAAGAGDWVTVWAPYDSFAGTLDGNTIAAMKTIRVDLFADGAQIPGGTEVIFANLRFVKNQAGLSLGYMFPEVDGGDGGEGTPPSPPGGGDDKESAKTGDSAMVALAILALILASGMTVFAVRKVKA
jgi:LPXTG-motif cell wall-anchored protein